MFEDIFTEGVVNALVLTGVIVGVYVALLWTAAAYWTFADARRRSRHIFFALAASLGTFFLFLPGLWVYLLVRPRETLAERLDDRLRSVLAAEYDRMCPGCRGFVRDEYVLCPSCGLELRNSCTGCSHAIESFWKMCPYCGQKAIPVFSEERKAEERVETRQPVHV